MHVRLREKQSVISRAKVKATTQPHIPSGRRKCNSESHKSQFRNPQIILSFPLRRAGVKVRSWWHFPAGSIRIRHRPKQEPTNLGLNTDPHPSTSSSSLFSSSSSFGFLYFAPNFTVFLYYMFTPQTLSLSRAPFNRNFTHTCSFTSPLIWNATTRWCHINTFIY